MGSDSEKTSHLSPPERFDQTLEPQASPSKRLKTLTQSPSSSPPPSSSKGKDKVCDESTESQCCGICLSDDERVIRGWIESCDHYFCFVCIMEWAKVESRCPLCKRRFSTIRRPPVEGLFLAERVVNVPVRDQVYHIYGNATVAHQDPYSLAKCTVCNGEADESLLLLCDLCDSAAHTYCVGMGATVPEGDWFCQDCTVSRAEHSKSETDTNVDSQDSLNDSNQISFSATNVSLRDIVRETNFRGAERSRSTVPPNRSALSSPQGSSLMRQDRRTRPMVPATTTATDLGARTVRRCRNVQGRIRELRENWNRFRSGSMSFSSSSVDSRGNTNQIPINSGNPPDRSDQPLSTPPSSHQVPIQKGSSLNTTPIRSSYNEAKAWKMLNAAKSLEKSRKKTNLFHQRLKKSVAEVGMPLEGDNMSPNLQVSSCKALKMAVSADGLHLKHHQCQSPAKENRSHKSQVLAIQEGSKFEKLSKFGESSSIQAPGKHQLPCSVKVLTSIQANAGQNIFGKPSEQNLCATSSDVCTLQDRSVSFISRVGSATVVSNASGTRLNDSVQANGCQNNFEKLSVERSHAKLSDGCTVSNESVRTPRARLEAKASNTSNARLESSSSSKIELPPGKAKEQCHAGSKSRIDDDDDAKGQIQFLVKLNLKLVTRDKKLEVDTFKEIARLSTHSILAACGLKQLKPGARSFPPSACPHSSQVVKPRMSTLMPCLCIECFHVFVKDVVNTVMSEKIGSVQRSSQ